MPLRIHFPCRYCLTAVFVAWCFLNRCMGEPAPNEPAPSESASEESKSAESKSVVAELLYQWNAGPMHNGVCVNADRGTNEVLYLVDVAIAKVRDSLGIQPAPVGKSPLSYALHQLTDVEKQRRYEILVGALESSEPTGRTLYFEPKIDPAGFEPSKQVDADDADFWSFKPLATDSPPSNAKKEVHPIDAFIADKLSEKELTQNFVANDEDLLRRVCYDTTGLPPSPERQKKWRNDAGDASYAELVEQLLDDKAFGERWSRFWLDLSRYADSDGYEDDNPRPRAFSFRDFATWAMNSDLPYKLFVQWQIAGDQLEPENPMAVAATGFIAGAPINVFFPQESERMDELDDIVSTMGRAMLGLSIGCARCHDHRYDPIPTEDYYRLVAAFQNTKRSYPYLLPDAGKAYKAATDTVTEKRAEILKMLMDSLKEKNIRELEGFTCEEKDILRLPEDPDNKEQAYLLFACKRCLWINVGDLDHDSQILDVFQQRYTELTAEIDQLYPTLPSPAPTGLTVTGGAAEPFHVLKNGDLNRKADLVNPGFVSVLTTSQPDWAEDTWQKWMPSGLDTEEHYPRTALAVWLCDTEHGAGALLARVIVNRIWQQYFGRGIVNTPSDFGMEGSNPTHPELLDWLAAELVANDWSLKHVHRLILTSRTYQQSCDNNPDFASIDPQNKFLWRQNRKRLTAEMLRDSMLAAGGNLNRKMYGPSIMPQIPKDAIISARRSPEETWPMLDPNDPESSRRSLYIATMRTMSVPLMKLFDAPDGSISCETRTTTTVPTQALALWNSDFVRRQSYQVAQRVLAAAKTESPTPEDFIVSAYQHVLLRDPTPKELRQCLAFAKDLFPSTHQLAELCQVLMLTNEFAYLN